MVDPVFEPCILVSESVNLNLTAHFFTCFNFYIQNSSPLTHQHSLLIPVLLNKGWQLWNTLAVSSYIEFILFHNYKFIAISSSSNLQHYFSHLENWGFSYRSPSSLRPMNTYAQTYTFSSSSLQITVESEFTLHQYSLFACL